MMWIYLKQYVITSAKNKSNFYSIGVLGVQLFHIEKWFSTSTQHSEKSQNWESLVENGIPTSEYALTITNQTT